MKKKKKKVVALKFIFQGKIAASGPPSPLIIIRRPGNPRLN